MKAVDKLSSHPRTVLHIGMKKTATTLLQQCLFEKHTEVNYIRSICPVRYLNCPSEMHEGIIKDAQQEMESQWRAGRVCVFSREKLSGGSLKKKLQQAEILRRVFGDCQILITIREPLSWTESFYFQQLKVFNSRRPPYALFRTFGRPPRYFDINEWLSVMMREEMLGDLYIAETAEVYAEKFGKENVSLVIFEKLKQTPREFLADICRCIGISLEEAITLCEGQTKNVRWTETSVDRLKRLEGSFLAKWIHRFKRTKKRESNLHRLLRIHEEAVNPTAPKARANLEPKWKEVIEKIGREQSQEIVEQWGLPLAAYGYPLPEN